jgi:metallo-beta-lactamase class B
MRGVCFYLSAGLFFAALCLLGPARAAGQADETSRSWNQPVEPYRVIGNVYYVGASDVTSFLIVTPAGHILLDSGLAETVPLIRRNIARLGFRMGDIKILINSHAHYDHAGGLALLKEETGARLLASEADAALLAAGGRGDFHFGDRLAYAPVRADRVLRDGDRAELGGVKLVARLTPGHTKGSTTWTMKVREGRRSYDVVFAGSTSVPGYKLVGNPQYPGIVADYERTFRLLKRLPCDEFLGPHGQFFSMREKAELLARGQSPNPFLDARGYRNYIARNESAFREQLQRERQAARSESGLLMRGARARREQTNED